MRDSATTNRAHQESAATEQTEQTRGTRTRTLAALLLAGGLAAAVPAALSPLGTDRASSAPTRDTIRSGVDPNSASWDELAQLPGVGEKLARKIVAYREARRQALVIGPEGGRGNVPNVIFHRADDLRSVRGIGPRTIMRIAPFLRFDAAAQPRE